MNLSNSTPVIDKLDLKPSAAAYWNEHSFKLQYKSVDTANPSSNAAIKSVFLKHGGAVNWIKLLTLKLQTQIVVLSC